MDRRTLVLVVLVMTIIVLGMFFFSYLKQNERRDDVGASALPLASR